MAREVAAYEAHPCVWRAAPFTVTVVSCLTAGIGYLVWRWISRFSTLRVSENGVRYVTGVLRRDEVHITPGRLSTYRIERSLMQRLTATCSLEVYGAGDAPEIVVNGLGKVESLASAMKGIVPLD